MATFAQAEVGIIMAINGSSILSGATLAATGGSAKTFTIDGQIVANGVHASDMSVADFKLRPGLTFKARMPSKKSDGTWQKGKFSATLTVPKLKADTTVDFPLARVEMEFSDESTAAELLELRKQIAQVLFDSDYDQFWTSGNKA